MRHEPGLPLARGAAPRTDAHQQWACSRPHPLPFILSRCIIGPRPESKPLTVALRSFRGYRGAHWPTSDAGQLKPALTPRLGALLAAVSAAGVVLRTVPRSASSCFLD
ncbi:hypothetical protein NDU88_010529 [Pleurodeles waltl]|uniref:Uncharacterized protein n=1 Tax=Pleurodeles waltl TaxID=8319 RepID=A0AAV7PY76_PLEWA|nr:hypothetical protein NDU88_010529 [Pleurodeles waltl]